MARNSWRQLAATFVVVSLFFTALAFNGTPRAGGTDARAAPTPEPEFVALFDGSEASFQHWEVAGLDGFTLEDGMIVARPVGEDLGLLYFAPRTFGNFLLRLEFRVNATEDNSGVYVRFRDPRLPVPATLLSAPGAAETFLLRDYYSDNAAYPAIDTGFEVQIDDLAAGDPSTTADDGQELHRTGAFYDVPIGDSEGEQRYTRPPALELGRWYTLEIEVVSDTYSARIDGRETATFTNVNVLRGLSPADDAESGYIGIQSHPFSDGHVDFRNIRIKEMDRE